MKRLQLLTYIPLAILLLLTACYNDEAVPIDNPTQQDGKITVHLRVLPAAPATTRADWQDTPNAKDEEMMNVWTVVITDNEGAVQKILACEPKEEDREIDPIEYKLELATGTYHFYSFANISPEYVKYLLGLSTSTTKPTNDDTFDGINKGVITDITTGGTITKTDAEAKTIGINGNGFNVNATNNGFLSYGIPMSNVQTIEIKQPTEGTASQNIDLIVIRMLAKIKLQITNESGSEMKIKSIKLTNITANNDNNLMLLPNINKGHDTMESNDGYHGDIQPNLNGTPSQTDVEVLDNNITIENGGTEAFTFYVNESKNPKGQNWGATTTETSQDFNHFFLKIMIDKGSNKEELRYALIDDNGTEKWDYIARNDYRIIPIVLDDYKLDIIPYDFPAIGVYPASVKEEDGIYTINFHDYGHFHLVPQVTRYSDSSVVPYGNSENATYWTFEDGNKILSQSALWGSWTDASKKYAYYNEATDFAKEYDGYLKTLYHDVPFYRQGHTTEIKDGDDAGGEPVWYRNAASSSPQWDPAGGTNYQPFIFGYINEHPKPAENQPLEDRKVYHEFTINLHKSGTTGTARQMTYRLYMILDTDQMLYSSRALDAPAARHTHHGPHI